MSSQSALLHLSAYTAVFLATQNGGVVSRFPSTVRFTFGYVRYCIRSIVTISKKPGHLSCCHELKPHLIEFGIAPTCSSVPSALSRDTQNDALNRSGGAWGRRRRRRLTNDICMIHFKNIVGTIFFNESGSCRSSLDGLVPQYFHGAVTY